jgi:hypothetical protein
MLHLPALKLTGEIEKVFRAAQGHASRRPRPVGRRTERPAIFIRSRTRPRSARAKKRSSATSSTS